LTAVHLKIAFSTASVPLEKSPADFSNPAKGGTETDEVPIEHPAQYGQSADSMING